MERLRTTLLAAVAAIACIPMSLPAQAGRDGGDRPRMSRDAGPRRSEAPRQQYSRERAQASRMDRGPRADAPRRREGDTVSRPSRADGRPGQWNSARQPPRERPAGVDGGARRPPGDNRWAGDRRPNDPRWNNPSRNDQRWSDARRGTDRRWNNIPRDDRRWSDARRRDDRRWNDGRRWDNDRRWADNRRWNDNNRWNDNRRGYNDRRGWDGRGYRADWRNDRRYDWRSWRNGHRDLFRHRYVPPRGWAYGYTPFYQGAFLQTSFYASSYWLADPWAYRLPPVSGPYQWVRYYDDVLLVDVGTGEVVDVIEGFFW
jgi:hypothetical protein